MIGFDPSPWLLLTVPFLGVVAYLCYRGFARNQFREAGKWGWFTYRRGSLDWYSATLVNLTFLACGLFTVYQSAFHGTEFTREPVYAMPTPTGRPIRTLSVARDPDSLARCLAKSDRRDIYALNDGSRRVAVRNGRGQIMYIYEIVPAGSGSRLDIYRSLPSPFVSWDRCLTPSG